MIRKISTRDATRDGASPGLARSYTFPIIAGLVASYVVLHAPWPAALTSIAGWDTRSCVSCTGTTTITDVVDALAALVLACAALAAAWMLAHDAGYPDYEKPLVCGLVALALVAVPASAIGSAADRFGATWLEPPWGPLLCSIPSFVIAALMLRRGRRVHPPGARWPRPTPFVTVIGGIALLTMTTSVVLSLMHPATSGDALSYHAPLAVFLWRDGNLGAFLDRAPALWALAHPGTAELWFGLLRLIGGERLADLGQLPFALLGAAAVYAFARRLRVPHNPALFSAFAFLLAPMVVMQSGSQPNDVVGSALVMITIVLASAPPSEWNARRLAWIGLGLGLTAVTKLALIPYVAAIGAFVAGACAWGRTPTRQRVARVALMAVCFCVAVAPWWTRNILRYGNPLFPAALPIVGRGVFVHDLGPIDIAFVPSPLAWPLYPALEPHDDRSGFGALFLVGAIPGLVCACSRGPRRPMALFLFSTLVMMPAWWLMTLHEPRFFLPSAGLAFAFIPWALAAIPRTRRTYGAAVLAIAALFSALVTYDQALLPLARQPNTRPEFYDRVWGVDPATSALPEGDGVFLNTGFAPSIFEYASYYPLLGASQSRLVIPEDSDVTTGSIVARMRRTGVRYAYVAASPENRSQVEALYDPAHFELMHRSTIVVGESAGVRRSLYRRATDDEEPNGTRRYLYRLR